MTLRNDAQLGPAVPGIHKQALDFGPDKKGPGHSPGPAKHSLRLLQVPTGLADGFGLKELPYPDPGQEFTPIKWVPRSPSFADEDSAITGCKAAKMRCFLTRLGRAVASG